VHSHPVSASLRGAPLALVLLAFFAGAVAAAPVPGFVEHWPGTSLQGWSSQSDNSNPGTGGYLGAGDGYLLVSAPSMSTNNLGTASFGPEFTGNWTAAGITQVRVWLNDVGTDDPLEIHFSTGNGANFWQYNVAFLPPHNQWAQFTVDLTNSANWTRIIGFTGTFAQALSNVDRVHLRHDNAPFSQVPNPVTGDVGIDRLLLTNGIVDVPAAGAVAPRALQLSAPTPNPSRGPVAFRLETYDAEPVTIEVLDAAGRLVRRAEVTASGAGARTWVWDGRDAAGRRTAPGYYGVHAMGAAGGVSRGLVRVE